MGQKIGDSLQWHLQLLDDDTELPIALVDGQVTARIRGLNGGVGITPVLTLMNQGTNPGEFDMVVADGEVFRTAPQPLFCDLQVEDPPLSGLITSTETFKIVLVQDVTP